MLLQTIIVLCSLLTPISALEIIDLQNAGNCSRDLLRSFHFLAVVSDDSGARLRLYDDVQNLLDEADEYLIPGASHVKIAVDRNFIYYWDRGDINSTGFAAPITELPSRNLTHKIKIVAASSIGNRTCDKFVFEDRANRSRKVCRGISSALIDGFTGKDVRKKFAHIQLKRVDIIQVYDGHLLLMYRLKRSMLMQFSKDQVLMLLVFPSNPSKVCHLGTSSSLGHIAKWKETFRFVIQRNENYTSPGALEKIVDKDTATTPPDIDKLESAVGPEECGASFGQTPLALMISAVIALFVSFILYSVIVCHRLKLKKSYEEYRESAMRSCRNR